MITQQLMEILVCPACRGTLQFDEEAAQLNCLPCELSYPVIHDIPVMLVEKAAPLVVSKE
jgi:uncharacterized protein YbaR (Trm112 family)